MNERDYSDLLSRALKRINPIEGGRTALDTLATLAGQASTQIPAGLAGLGKWAMTGDINAGADTVEDVQNKYGYKPMSEGGRQAVSELGQGMTTLLSPLTKATDVVGEWSPSTGAALAGIGAVVDPLKGAGKAGKLAKNARVAEAAGELASKLKAKELPAVQAPREVDLANRFQSGEKAGTYRGTEAFGGITPAKLGQMRRSYVADALAGEPHSKYWYDDTSNTILDLTGGNVADADKLAHALSVTSSSTPVKTNAMFGFKGWNQALTGDPVHTGQYPTRMSADIVRGWSGEGADLGLKRDPYRAGLSVAWNPNPDLRPTNDIHQMRAWGVRDPATGELWSKGVKEAGHRFIDEQTRWATDRLNDIMRERGQVPDWTQYRTQAAAWAPQRVKTGQAKSMAEAAEHYGAAVDPYSAHVTREWTPGETSGHLAEMLRAGPEARQQYATAMENVVTGRAGIDQLARDMGALTGQTIENRGVYEGNVNPGYVSRIPVGKTTGSHAVEPSSAKVLDAVAGAHGLVGLQDQAAWNFITGQPPAKRAGAFQVQRETPLDMDELAALNKRLEGQPVSVQADPAGARVLNFGGEDTSRQLARLLRGENAAPREMSGNLFPADENFNKPAAWSSKPYIEKIEAGGPRMVEGFNTAMQRMAPEMLQATDALAKQHGWTQAAFYRPMMEALGSGGLPALKELVRQGVVPVAVLGTISALLGQQETADVQ